MADFLFEIGCEEIPARMIDARVAGTCATRVHRLLDRERLAARECVDSSRYAAPPGRAGARIFQSSSQMIVEEQMTGPSVNVAFKDGQPTPAAHAFAKKAGVEVAQLERVTTRRANTCPRSHEERAPGG